MKRWICLVAVVACGPTPPASVGDGDGDGARADGGDAPVDDDDDIDNPPNGCPEPLELTPSLPPRLLIVLDRSGSMEPIWDGATDAIKDVVSGLDSEAGWGMSLFPSADDGCAAESIAVDLATDNYAPIAAAIDDAWPTGATPTYKAIEIAREYLVALPDDNPKYVVLITDGIPNCGEVDNCECPPGFRRNSADQCSRIDGGPFDYYSCDQPQGGSMNATYWAMDRLRRDGIPTFVFGLATFGAGDFGLNVLAEAGGEARSSFPQYYPADTPDDLEAMLQSLSAGLISCSFALPDVQPGVELIALEIDGVIVPRDPTRMDGWDYDASGTSIRVYGSACDLLQLPGDRDVRAIFECPAVP